MSKYIIRGNSLTKGPKDEDHPSIDLGIKDNKWENIEITSSPTKKDKYTKFDLNPNPKWREGKNKKESYFRRYLRKDPIWARRSIYKKYSLIESDEKKVDSFLEERRRNIEIDRKRREQAAKRKNDAKLRYHQRGRSASQRISAKASSSVIKAKKYKQVNIKGEKIHARKSKKK